METILSSYSKFLNTDFKLHPSAFLEVDTDEHTSLDQRKENQRITRALRRLYTVFDSIWDAQNELKRQLRETGYLERHAFNEHGLREWFKEASKAVDLHKEFTRLIRVHSNEPIIKEYYEKMNEFNKDLFPLIHNGDILKIVNSRAEEEIVLSRQQMIEMFQAN